MNEVQTELRWYVLNEKKEVIQVANYLEWARWFAANNEKRLVARDTIGETTVSTVFIGFDHRLLGEGPPLIFETMIFKGPEDGLVLRCSTWKEAEAQHREAVAVARSKLQ